MAVEEQTEAELGVPHQSSYPVAEVCQERRLLVGLAAGQDQTDLMAMAYQV